MIIEAVKSESDENQRKIKFSDGSFFSFKICYLPPLGIDEDLYTPGTAEGREINPDQEEAFRFASACLRAEKAALQLIARAEQNVFRLSGKLEKRGHPPACIRAVIVQLGELGLVDDSRYARLWLESRINRQTVSPRRLRAALRSKGIDRHDAEAALKEVLDDETERRILDRYVQKMRRRQKGSNASDEEHSLRYLLRGEGFSSLAIQSFFEG